MIAFENKLEIEKFSLITIYGLFKQVNLGLISIDDAECIFFTPYIMEELENYNVRQEIIDLVHEGTELENFETFNISVEIETDRLIKQTEALLLQYKNIEFTEKMLTEFIIMKKNPPE
ncbi:MULTISPECIES: DUF3969 family protein [Staphylococcus]|nr:MULTISPECIES: DUF3969 family protein [Staphylococcus]EJY95169.1 hypothetical protein SARL_09001 [Staphylococcus arlettae CVD059]ERF48960.1 hypothetical protein N039_01415 [Staphylococcus sp. EGD-HP3]MCD8863732.1 DUF3969 family protein [Staphylococcus arlettae]MCD9054249.1 DUF3969 family protein [Staphylococcus arlettae]MCP8714356.1 DUF3969 family protein [Staphylococcus arlettae]